MTSRRPSDATPSSSRRRSARGWAVLLLLSACAFHLAGRTAAFCCPWKSDSYLYGASAYQVWQSDATIDALVPNKPVGQALITGWVYHVWPWPPSRLTLAPIESAWMIAGFVTFWLLARRLLASRIADIVAVVLVLATNMCNALSATTDGFNVQDNYLAWPVLIAVLAHLTVSAPVRRGIIRGIGLALALSIKQSALGVAGIICVHGLVTVCVRRTFREGMIAGACTVVGGLLVWTPIVLFLYWRGWLWPHIGDLLWLSPRNVALAGHPALTLHKFWPLAPAMWWIVLGTLIAVGARVGRSGGGRSSRDDRIADQPNQADDLPVPASGHVLFIAAWAAGEIAIVGVLIAPAWYYYQMIAPPVVLLGGMCLTLAIRRIESANGRERSTALRWMGISTGLVVLLVATPLIGMARARAVSFDHQTEIRALEQWQQRHIPHDMLYILRVTRNRNAF